MSSDDFDGLLFKRRIVQLRGPINAENYERLVTKLLQLDVMGSREIIILIDSKGGDVGYALSLHDIIRSLRSKTKGVVIGECSSSALVVLQACTLRFAFPHAQFMFHTPKTTHTFPINRRVNGHVQLWAKHAFRPTVAMRNLLLNRCRLRKSDLNELERIGDEVNLTVGAELMLKYGIVDAIVSGFYDCGTKQKGG